MPELIIKEEIIIDAPTKCVWQQLLDFENFKKWNTFMTDISGNPRKGQKLKVTVQPPNNKPMTFTPTVLNVEKNRELRWVGNFIFDWLFRGEHSFTLVDVGEGKTKLVHTEKFTGLLVWFFKKNLNTNTRQGFKNMNDNLKQQSESVGGLEKDKKQPEFQQKQTEVVDKKQSQQLHDQHVQLWKQQRKPAKPTKPTKLFPKQVQRDGTTDKGVDVAADFTSTMALSNDSR